MADIDKGKNPSLLRWQPPSEYEDGSSITDLSDLSYNLYRRTPGEADYELYFVVVGELQTDGTYSAPLGDFVEGAHEIVLTAVDAEGDESAYSNSITFIIGVAPKPPIFL